MRCRPATVKCQNRFPSAAYGLHLGVHTQVHTMSKPTFATPPDHNLCSNRQRYPDLKLTLTFTLTLTLVLTVTLTLAPSWP